MDERAERHCGSATLIEVNMNLSDVAAQQTPNP
jgi:hypothetical protein